MTENYANPLDHFRSYSYHFVMTLASSSEGHRKLLEKDGFLSLVNNAKLGERVGLGGEKVFLVMDTRRYSQFSIMNLEMTQAYGSGSANNPSIPASEIKMKVLDTTGISFFNFLMNLMKTEIQSMKGSAYYMLSTIFVGHHDETSTDTVISMSHQQMIMAQMGFEFSSSGSIYDMIFVETEGNPGPCLPQAIDLSDIQAISTEGRDNTIGGLVNSLEDRLNINSLRFFQKYTNEAIKRGGSSGYSQAGKLVQYMITIPDEWKNFQINTATKSENVEQYFVKRTKATQAKIDDANKQLDDKLKKGEVKAEDAVKQRASYTNFSYSTSIQEAINVVLNSSVDYLKLGSEENMKSGKAVVPKIVVSTTSDNTTYLVHIDVYPYQAPIMEKGKDGKMKTNKNNFLTPDGKVKNLVYYDYMFTGKNSHILDLKVEFMPSAAVGFLDFDVNVGQQRLKENSSAAQSTKANDTASNDTVKKTSQFNPLMRPGEPIFPPAKTKDQQTGFANMINEEYDKGMAAANVRAKQEHVNTMAMLHYLGSSQTQMTIRGNPNLMRKFCDRVSRGGIPKHVLNMKAEDLQPVLSGNSDDFFKSKIFPSIVSGKSQYVNDYIKPRIKTQDGSGKGEDAILSGPDIAVGPLFAQVNIRAPNVDFLGNPIAGVTEFSTNEFFYTGVYLVPIITHIFDNGMFKQVLSLLPYDITGTWSGSQSAAADKTNVKA